MNVLPKKNAARKARPISVRVAQVMLLIFYCMMPGAKAQAQYHDYPRADAPAQIFGKDDSGKWTVDGEVRGRTEDQTAINYIPGQNQTYELTRTRGGVEFRPYPWLTTYMQFHDNHALALPLTYTASNMRDSFDLRQGFAELKWKPLKFFAGRQELKFGDERVIGISDWANNSRTWDGFDLRVGERNRVDVFSTSVVVVHPTSLDKHGAGLTFHGVEGHITSGLPRTTIEPFVLLRALPRVLSQQSVYGTETEVTMGTYAASQLPLGFDFSTTGTLQRGSYSNDSIHAGSGILKAGYTAKWLRSSPRLQGEYDYATGNPHRNALRIGTNDQIYPSNHNAFGLVDLFGFENIKQVRGNLDIKPAGNLSLQLQAGSLHVATVRDGVYSGSAGTTVKAPAAGFVSDDIGTEFDASAKYVYRRYLVANLGVGHLFPGELMTHDAHGAPLTLAYLGFTYRFKVE
jgi:transposase